MTWYVIDKREYLARLAEIGACWREVLGRTFPAMALVEVKGLVEARAKLEIETTALVPDEG
jgi:enamine deaminase RidA (YjgF/YER057c/UK114 family)